MASLSSMPHFALPLCVLALCALPLFVGGCINGQWARGSVEVVEDGFVERGDFWMFVADNDVEQLYAEIPLTREPEDGSDDRLGVLQIEIRGDEATGSYAEWRGGAALFESESLIGVLSIPLRLLDDTCECTDGLLELVATDASGETRRLSRMWYSMLDSRCRTPRVLSIDDETTIEVWRNELCVPIDRPRGSASTPSPSSSRPSPSDGVDCTSSSDDFSCASDSSSGCSGDSDVDCGSSSGGGCGADSSSSGCEADSSGGGCEGDSSDVSCESDSSDVSCEGDLATVPPWASRGCGPPRRPNGRIQFLFWMLLVLWDIQRRSASRHT